MMARMMDDVTRSELQRFEENLGSSISAAVDRVMASLFLAASTVIGRGCLLVASILLLGRWLPWWLTFAVAGLAIIAIGEIVFARYRRPHH
jgi:fatty acid desaturase